ncbi:Nicotinic acetylcholine receptor alpha 3 subunit [Gryllus bimaculatus]|nr:Nicotinic acetylcholine receptor alpha 3 subunit [Gryllus bimaculatus]
MVPGVQIKEILQIMARYFTRHHGNGEIPHECLSDRRDPFDRILHDVVRRASRTKPVPGSLAFWNQGGAGGGRSERGLPLRCRRRGGQPDAKRLYDDLLSNYNKLNLKNQIMTTNLWVEQSWYDYKLQWDPREYGGVEMLHVPSDHIWRPDIVLYNNADGNFEVTLATKATLNYTGRVEWKPPAIYKSSCEIDVEYFPFDEQTCVMKFGSWTYDGFQVDLRHIDEVKNSNVVEIGVDLSEFYTSVEWDILEVPAVRNEKYYTCCDEPYLDITFNITMRRKTLFYTVNLIIPCMGISFLTVLVFYLPSDSGEKGSEPRARVPPRCAAPRPATCARATPTAGAAPAREALARDGRPAGRPAGGGAARRGRTRCAVGAARFIPHLDRACASCAGRSTRRKRRGGRPAVMVRTCNGLEMRDPRLLAPPAGAGAGYSSASGAGVDAHLEAHRVAPSSRRGAARLAAVAARGAGGWRQPRRQALYDDLLLQLQQASVRPSVNTSECCASALSSKLSQLIDVNLKNQIMTTNLWVEQSWYDYKLRWEPREYGGVHMLHVPSDHIWRPDIVLYNNVRQWMTRCSPGPPAPPPRPAAPPSRPDRRPTPASPQVDLRHMDEKAGSNVVEVGVDLSEFYMSVEWDILEVPAVRNEKFYTCCDEPYLDITFNITMRRKTLFYTVNIIIPCMGISFLTVLTFYLPSDSGEKVTLSISILISLHVFFLLVVEIIPPTSLVVPLLGKYLIFAMILVSISICVTVVVLNVHFRSPQTHKMAPWVRRVFIHILPRLLVMRRPQYQYETRCGALRGGREPPAPPLYYPYQPTAPLCGPGAVSDDEPQRKLFINFQLVHFFKYCFLPRTYGITEKMDPYSAAFCHV